MVIFQTKLACMLQALYRRTTGLGDANRLMRIMVETKNSIILQRILRGFLGRLRSKKKAKFYHSISFASHCVSTEELTQVEMESFGDVFREILIDVNTEVSPVLLTLVRGLLYILNGSNAEWIYFYTLGVYEQKDIFADTLSWQDAHLFILRKEKLLRRLRAIARFVKSPNPQRLKFSESCIIHLNEMEINMSEKVFNNIIDKKAKICAVKLFYFCKHMKRAYDLQFEFPDYFDYTEPLWFISLISLTKKKEMAEFQYLICKSCTLEILENKKRFILEGKKWGAVLAALKISVVDEEKTEKLKVLVLKKLELNILNIENRMNRKMEYFEKKVRAKELGLQVAIGNLNVFRLNNFQNKERETELKNELGEAGMSFKETQIMQLSFIEKTKKDKVSLKFNIKFDLSFIYKFCKEVGIIQAKLLILNEIWQRFLKYEVGGKEYLSDLKNEKLLFYYEKKSEARDLIDRKTALVVLIDESLGNLLRNAFVEAENGRIDGGERNLEWDVPLEEELRGDVDEDKACAFKAGYTCIRVYMSSLVD